MASLRTTLGKQSDLVLVLGIVCILLLLFTPIPTWLLDFLLLSNFCFALLILLLTFYMGKPLEFSTFPSLLLIATLFRLGSEPFGHALDPEQRLRRSGDRRGRGVRGSGQLRHRLDRVSGAHRRAVRRGDQRGAARRGSGRALHAR